MRQDDLILCISTEKSFDFISASLPQNKNLNIKWEKDLPKPITGPCSLWLIELGSDGRNLPLLKEAVALDAESEVVSFSFEGSVRLAVESLRIGAENHYCLPDEIELLKKHLFLSEKRHEKRRTNREFLDQQKSRYDFSRIIGISPRLIEVLKVTERVIRSGMNPILIMGETGTGKGLLARIIHYNGPSREGPFVEVNCSAIPDNLLESELFGYEKGAFTGAASAKEGLFEIANEGTIFLDEIGHLNPSLQVKLLNAIEYKTIRRLGGTRNITVTPRIIAATSTDLRQAMEEKTFRSDMYFRLSRVNLILPPLRERGSDVLILAEHFLREFIEQYGSGARELSAATKKALLAHAWPGNIRELKNTIERAVVLSDGEVIGEEMLQFDEPGMDASNGRKTSARLVIDIPAEGISREEVERALVREILRLSDGNKSKAARILGVTRPTLMSMIKRHRLAGE